MPSYVTPGVYFEWLDSRPTAITPLRTDIAGFVGIASRGPVHTPMRVESLAQFTGLFGGPIPNGFLPCAVTGFFANGGQVCWIVRAADPATASPATLTLVDASGNDALTLQAYSPGVWGRNIAVAVTPNLGGRFTLNIRHDDGTQEIWRDLSLNSQDPRYVVSLLSGNRTNDVAAKDADPRSALRASKNDQTGSQLLALTDSRASDLQVQDTMLEATGFQRLTGGGDGLTTLTPAHLIGSGVPDRIWGLDTLEYVDEVAIVAIPDIMPTARIDVRHRTVPPRCDVLDATSQETPPETSAEFPPFFNSTTISDMQTALIAHCENRKDRVAVLDTPPDATTPALALAWRQQQTPYLTHRAQFDTSFAALYYPWLRVPDPLDLDGLLRAVPPSGYVAGVYARVDLTVGVHKSPANEVLADVLDTLDPIDDLTHGNLNSAGIDVIRVYGGRGIRIAGARTLSTDYLLRYVAVRRLLTMIEVAVGRETRWMTFEPNNPNLWSDTERVIGSFLNDLWRSGMLEGATAADAYFVKCDATTNPPEETDNGRMICLVGLLPPWPAEFVIVRIGKTENGTEILQVTGKQNA